MSPEGPAVERFALQAGEEGLAEGVVVRIADTAHGGTHTRLSAALPEAQ